VHQGAVEETQDGYPVLVLNSASWEILRGKRTVQLAVRARRPRTRKRSSAEKARPAETAAIDDPLFQRLRTLRKQLADAANVPPYVVFHDSTLREMAQRAPRSLEEFAALPGVGRTKLERYADAFIRTIAGHSADAL